MAWWDEMSYNNFSNRGSQMYEKDFYEKDDMTWLELISYVYEDEDVSTGAELITIVVDY